MQREFEFAAMRALTDLIIGAVKGCVDIEEFKDRCDLLMSMGIGVEECRPGVLVAYPVASPRRNPAVVVITVGDRPFTEWSSTTSSEGRMCYVYEAGKWDLARGCEKPTVRAKAQDTALYS